MSRELRFLSLLRPFIVLSFTCLHSSVTSMPDLMNPTITLYNSQTQPTGLRYQLGVQKRGLEMILFDEAIIQNCVNYITLHGHTTESGNFWAHELKDAILNAQTANVFIVDWFNFASANHRHISEHLVGQEVARLIADFFNEQFFRRVKFEKIAFVGHSIGARIANFAITQMSTKVNHLIALDPNKRPTKIRNLSRSQRVELLSTEASDKLTAAEHSLVLHTDSGNLGIAYNAGTTDVYLNGGTEQPGCENIQDNLIATRTNCNHNFAAKCFKSISLSSLLNYETNLIEKQRLFLREANKCFPIAYLCDSYYSFINGRCGSCNKSFPGLGMRRTCFHVGLPEPERNLNIELGEYRSNYFLGTDVEGDCLFTYRIIVGLRRKQMLEEGNSKNLNDKVFVRFSMSDHPSHSKTVELSAKFTGGWQMDVNADLRNQLFLSHQLFQILESEEEMEFMNPFETDFRSILVTFRTHVSRSLNESTNALGSPLESLSLVDVWGKNIETVGFVAFDYLSHFHRDVRLGHSFFLKKTQRLEERKNMDLPFFDYFATFSSFDSL